MSRELLDQGVDPEEGRDEAFFEMPITWEFMTRMRVLITALKMIDVPVEVRNHARWLSEWMDELDEQIHEMQAEQAGYYDDPFGYGSGGPIDSDDLPY